MSHPIDLDRIEEEVIRRFQPANPITEAIAGKLAQTLYHQQRCENLLEYARAFPTHKIDAMPAAKRAAFQQNVRKLRDRLLELKRTSREYSDALLAGAKPTTAIVQ
jgi:hypothetical protein